jgi:hypothetical protein
MADKEGIQAATAFIEAFRNALAVAKNELPSVRCIARPALIAILSQAKDLAEQKSLRKYSGTGLLRLLEKAGVVRPLPLVALAKELKSDRIYAVGLDVAVDDLEPAEILQAHVADGILCYFTAIELHELSTQVTAHHHIARIKKFAEKHIINGVSAPSKKDPSYPLGKVQFSLDGVKYYLTNRDATGVRQFQRRYLNSSCVVTVTTIEQTLLDCLHRPSSCGGPSVIFEAWATGMARTNPIRLIDLAHEIGDVGLLRRAGYMLSQHSPDAGVLDALLQELPRHAMDEDSLPSLLPGTPYSNIDMKWGLRVP